MLGFIKISSMWIMYINHTQPHCFLLSPSIPLPPRLFAFIFLVFLLHFVNKVVSNRIKLQNFLWNNTFFSSLILYSSFFRALLQSEYWRGNGTSVSLVYSWDRVNLLLIILCFTKWLFSFFLKKWVEKQYENKQQVL